jgi:hypothetical protein
MNLRRRGGSMQHEYQSSCPESLSNR